MSEQINKKQDELAKMIERYSGRDGVYKTAIPSLFFIRQSDVTGPNYRVYKPCFCIIAQGMKEVLLAQERYRYSPADYLVASVALPVTGQVMEASSDVPYLAFKLEFTPSQILEVLTDSMLRADRKENAKRGMYVSQIESSLLEAVMRLVRLLDTPNDIPVLAPLFTKEILYRVLQGPHGGALAQMATEGSNTYRIRDVIKHIMDNYNESLRIEKLAEIANMGGSSLHRHLKR